MERTHPDAAVAGTRFRIRWIPETGSTNSDVAALAAAGEPEGLVLVADHQSAGRGRLGRSWTAPSGSALLCSFLLRPSGSGVHLAVTAVGCAAAAACAAVAGVEPGLKWPNDLVVGTGAATRKLAGVLAEAATDGERVTAVVVGLGLNVVRAPDFPAELAEVATSLDQHGALDVDRRRLAEAICTELEHRCHLADHDPIALLAEYRSRCVTIGQDVRVEQPGGTWEGRATGVTDGCALEVTTATGVRVVEAGDVVHLRSA